MEKTTIMRAKLTLNELIKDLKLPLNKVAIELNREIVDKKKLSSR